MSDPKALLLKATPELLEGWCGPGKVVWGDGLVEDCVIRTIDGDPHFWTEEVCDWWRASDTDIMRFAIHLDLARAECRDRVARVVAARVGAIPGERFFHYRDGCWRFERGFSFCADRSPEQWRIPFTVDLVVVALATLDPHDDTRLSDGSRLVDALALHAAATEVLHG